MSDFDSDILKTLKNIEKALGRSSSVFGGSAREPKAAGTATTEARAKDTSDKSTSRTIVATTKAIGKLGGTASRTTNALTELAKQASKGSTKFADLNTAVDKAISELQKVPGKISSRVMAKPAYKAAKKEEHQAVKATVRSLADKSKQEKRIAKASVDREKSRMTGQTAQIKKSIKKVQVKPSRDVTSPVLHKDDAQDDIDVQSPGKKSKLSGYLQETIKNSASNLFANLLKVADEAFDTSATRGYGTLSGFASLSAAAISAGMSLKEYTQFLDNNMGALSRSSSIEDFQKQLSVGTDALAKFGVFGADATQMTASMVSSSQALGVPMDQMSSSINNQISVFEQLRKTTGITSVAFEKITEQIMSNDAVQKEMLGLSAGERDARKTQITQLATFGTGLGLSTQAASQLTSALLEQRKSTVKQRFEQKGRLRQALALAGFSDVDQTRAAELQGKRNKTSAEEQELLDIKGRLGQSLESMKQDESNPGSQNIAEQASGLLDTAGLGSSMEAAMNVQLAKESGTQKNADMGKTLSNTEQAIGKSNALLSAIAASTAVIAAASVGSMLFGKFSGLGKGLAGLFGAGGASSGGSLLSSGGFALGKGVGKAGAAGSSVLSSISSFFTGGNQMGPPMPETPNFPPKPGMLTKAGRALGGIGKIGAIGTAVQLGATVYGAASKYNNADAIAAAGDGDVGAVKGEAVGQGVGGTAGMVIGGLLGSFGGPLGTMLGISVGATIGESLGGWMGKMWGSESSNEKNTRELVKLTRAKAGAETISDTNIDSLSANVMKTAIAFSAPTQAQVDAYADSKLTPEQKKKKDADAVAAQASSVMTYDAMGNATGFESSIAPATSGSITSVQSSVPLTTIGTPTPIVQNSVQPIAINTPSDSAVPAGALPQSVVNQLSAPGQDQGAVLTQILQILQQSLEGETDRGKMMEQALRGTNRFQDNTTMSKLIYAA
jgi:hypothetical protein